MAEDSPQSGGDPAPTRPKWWWLGRASTIATCTCIVVAVLVFANLVNESKALSYLSSDPKACINCHVMHAQYNTWKHSSHAEHATCVDCHLPHDNMVSKYISKSRDGWNHSVAFTLNNYEPAITISDDGARRVQQNCISCHSMASKTMRQNAAHYEFVKDPEVETGRRCWDCHQSGPHGKVRAINTTPYFLGHQEQTP